MCTVTFLPLGQQDFVLTSSRDVSYKRAKAIAPEVYREEGVKLFYPRDGKAGGTWIGSSRDNRLICLLNGGFKNHQIKDSYRKSRGLIVKDLLKATHFKKACEQIDLNGIEPFTLVVVDWADELVLREFVWDGSDRHLRTLEPRPRIWSSSTLFTEEMKRMREDWFDRWIVKSQLGRETIMNFHKTAGISDPEVDVFLRRSQVGTVSITQFFKEDGKTGLSYEPFSSDQESDE